MSVPQESALKGSHDTKWLILTLICVAIGWLLYLPVLDRYPFLDDFWLLAHMHNPQGRWDLFQPIAEYLFRPPQRLIAAANVELLGFDSFWLIRVVQILSHGLNILLVISIGRKMHMSPQVAFLGGVFFAVMSVNTIPLSHIYSAEAYSMVFVLIVCYLWLRMSRTGRSNSRWQQLAGGLASLLALLCKETAIGPILGIGLLTLILFVRNKATLSVTVKRVAALVIIPLVVYLSLRWLVGGAFQMSGGRYHLSLGVNVLRNTVMLLGGLLYQGSTLDIFPTINPGRLAIGLTLTVVFVMWLGWSFWLLLHRAPRQQRDYLVYTVVMVFASFVPVILSQWVGEAYLYTSAPFWALTLMLLLDRSLCVRKSISVILYLFFIILALVQVAGVLDKQSRLASMGVLSQHYIKQACHVYNELPANTILCWQSDEAYGPGYSYFVQDHFIVYRSASHFCAEVSSKDVRVLDARNQTDLAQCTYFISEQDDGELIFTENK